MTRSHPGMVSAVALLACTSLGDQSHARTCDDLEGDAYELRATVQACSTDADCTLGSFKSKCVDAFLCDIPVNADRVNQLAERAATISDAYRRNCVCMTAKCPTYEGRQLRCVAATCKAEPAPRKTVAD